MTQATGLSRRRSLRLIENGAIFLFLFAIPAMIPTHTSSSADGEDSKWGRGGEGRRSRGRCFPARAKTNRTKDKGTKLSTEIDT